MTKILFLPFSVLSGILAGIIGRKTFERVWGIFDADGTPDPRQREVAFPKLIVALMLEGAIFATVRGLAEHGSRSAFSRLTGRWPGEEPPESA
jgi:Protein of unknown function (DUF4235)